MTMTKYLKMILFFAYLVKFLGQHLHLNYLDILRVINFNNPLKKFKRQLNHENRKSTESFELGRHMTISNTYIGENDMRRNDSGK